MPFMKIVGGKVNKGKIILFDSVSSEAVVEDLNGNRYMSEHVKELTKEEEEKYMKVEEIEL